MRKTLIIVTSICILFLFGIVSSVSYNMGVTYGEQNAEDIRESRVTDSLMHEKTIPTVNIKTIHNGSLETEISSSGRVLSFNSITISSEVNGKLQGEFSIKKGTSFRKGDLLFKVKDTDMRLLSEAKKSSFMNLLSSILADIKIDFPNEYPKWEQFFASISLEKNLQNLPKTNSVKEKNFIISRGIMSEYLSVKSDEEKLSKYSVYAPFDGSITKSYTDILANVNMGSPVIDVVRKGKMEVELTVNTSEIDLISVGNVVTFYNNAKEYLGYISRKGEFVNPKTQNISVFVEIPENKKDLSLYSGMYLEAKISTELKKDGCKIPRRSLISENEVYVINTNNKLEIVNVNIVSEQGNFIVIDNIENGKRVVVEPLINAKEGSLVNPLEN